MQVIGAGFGRTGTMSMQAALEILGYRCYHMKEVTEHEGHLDAWHALVDERESMNWQWLFRDFQATVDFPACTYYRELMAEYPDAKVVLTVRDADRWFDSFETLQNTTDSFRIFRFIPRARRFLAFVDTLLPKVFGNPRDRAACVEVFERHNREVQSAVPAERLLVFRVQDGWEPLCQFLGREVPVGVPFPHLNEGKDTLKKLARERLFGNWIRLGKVTLIAAVLLALAWWLLK
jgi:hypothetical protein